MAIDAQASAEEEVKPVPKISIFRLLVLPLLSLLPLVLAAPGAAAEEAGPQPARTAWVGATVYAETGAAARTDRVIVTRGERIEAVLPAAGFSAAGDMTLVDVHGKFLIPGLINTHVHLATSADPAAAKAYLRREIYSGVTAVRDMAGDARLLAELKREAEFNEIASPDIEFAALMAGPGFFQNPKTQQASRGRVPGEAPWMQEVDGRTNLALAVARAKGTGATGIKLYANMSAALVSAITTEAHRQGMLVWSHATLFPARPSDVVRARVDVISHACMLGYEVTRPLPGAARHPPLPVDAHALARGAGPINALLAHMKTQGTMLDATLFVYDMDDSGIDCFYSTAAGLAASAYRAGVPISSGTDDEPGDYAGPYSALIKELALLHDGAGMAPADILRAATVNGARAIGRAKDMGTIEAGKLANFVVLEQDPLRDIRHLESVTTTVRNGIAYPRSGYEAVGHGGER
jgi:imidazolonepropionase-like amidohydrolase